ncbi:MAG: hypothetical protein AAF639_41920 [Chloroflexota bacterium]
MGAAPDAKRLWLEVEAENEKGLSFYRKHGFVEQETKEDVIEGEMLQTIVMEKQL